MHLKHFLPKFFWSISMNYSTLNIRNMFIENPSKSSLFLTFVKIFYNKDSRSVEWKKIYLIHQTTKNCPKNAYRSQFKIPCSSLFNNRKLKNIIIPHLYIYENLIIYCYSNWLVLLKIQNKTFLQVNHLHIQKTQ